MTRVVVLAVLALSARAGADRTVADKLFEKGRELQAKKDWAGAAEAFEASLKEEAAPGTLYNLGRCHEELGKIASAYTEYNDVVAQMKSRFSFGPPKHTLDTLSGTRILPRSEPSLA